MYRIIKTQAYHDRQATKTMLPRLFQTYDEAERAVMVMVNVDIRHHGREGYLPVYDIIKEGV